MAAHFDRDLFAFLKDLEANNNREWFKENQDRFEASVREPALAFIRDVGEALRPICPHIVADDRKVGGSLFRIQRDIRFSKDKTPYKTWIGMRFFHDRVAADGAQLGYYLGLEQDKVTMGAGMWHPPKDSLAGIRDRIAAKPDQWQKVLDLNLDFMGESLVRPPRGYPAEHIHIEDLKRKDFAAHVDMKPSAAVKADFLDRYVEACRRVDPLQQFLAEAVGIAWR